mmetsp:Transcript_63770/g.93376  ORF Transcript_63770/g.93376 Transcript_63770/m.93376 type:complete len:177 (-) Transcript_63770:311-841(-)
MCDMTHSYVTCQDVPFIDHSFTFDMTQSHLKCLIFSPHCVSAVREAVEKEEARERARTREWRLQDFSCVLMKKVFSSPLSSLIFCLSPLHCCEQRKKAEHTSRAHGCAWRAHQTRSTCASTYSAPRVSQTQASYLDCTPLAPLHPAPPHALWDLTNSYVGRDSFTRVTFCACNDLF